MHARPETYKLYEASPAAALRRNKPRLRNNINAGIRASHYYESVCESGKGKALGVPS